VLEADNCEFLDLLKDAKIAIWLSQTHVFSSIHHSGELFVTCSLVDHPTNDEFRSKGTTNAQRILTYDCLFSSYRSWMILITETKTDVHELRTFIQSLLRKCEEFRSSTYRLFRVQNWKLDHNPLALRGKRSVEARMEGSVSFLA
jgi:hypothetical protein